VDSLNGTVGLNLRSTPGVELRSGTPLVRLYTPANRVLAPSSRLEVDLRSSPKIPVQKTSLWAENLSIQEPWAEYLSIQNSRAEYLSIQES